MSFDVIVETLEMNIVDHCSVSGMPYLASRGFMAATMLLVVVATGKLDNFCNSLLTKDMTCLLVQAN